MAYIPAFYVSANSFRVQGNHTGDYPPIMVMLYQGDPTPACSPVVSSSFDQTSGLTTVIVAHNCCTTLLSRVELGETFYDPVTQTGNIGPHDHSSDIAGGFMSVSVLNRFTEDMLDGLALVPILSSYSANQVLGITADGQAYEPKTVAATAHQTTVTHMQNQIRIGTVQNLDTDSSPTFYDLTLSSLTGLLISDGTDGVAGLFGTAGSLAVRDASTWTTLAPATDGQLLTLASGAPAWANPQLKALGDVDPTVSTAGATGDLMVRGATNYQRLPKGGDSQVLSISPSGVVQWADNTIGFSMTAGEDLAAYNVVYSDTANSGKWKKAQQDGTAAEAEAWGITTAAIANAAFGPIHLFGPLTNPAWTWTPGAILWLDATAGGMTETEPSTGYKVRLGHAIGETMIFFNPSPPIS